MEWRPEFIAPLLSALAAGALIGYEREFRARAAGFRTHTLVAVASALLMLAAQHQIEWAGVAMTSEVMRIDPVRMAHGVLTGLGFLCGGVIFKEGLSAHRTSDDGAFVIYDITLTSRGRLGADALVKHLSADGRLVAYDIEPRNL